MTKMAKINDTEQPSGSRGKQTGISPSAARLKRKLGDAPGWRNLTPQDIELLRKSKKEMAKIAGKVLAGKTVAGNQDETGR